MSKSQKELHLFMPIGDDEIQVDSYDKKLNKQVLKLKEEEPDAFTSFTMTRHRLFCVRQ